MRFRVALPLFLAIVLSNFAAFAQDAPKTGALSAREKHKEKINESVIYLMGGQLGGGYLKLAHDVSVALQDDGNLRILPVVGGAAVQNVRDVLFLKGIDLALTTVQALNLVKESTEIGTNNLKSEVAYVAPLFPDEMHVIVPSEINSIKELAGKKIGINNAGSQTAILTPKIFKMLGVSIEGVPMPQEDAIDKIKKGELAGSVCICPKPVTAFPNIPATAGLKLIGVDYAPGLQDDGYLPVSLSSDDYPNLIPKGSTVETVATQTLLVTYNWPKNSPRYLKVQKFVEAFYVRYGELMKPPRNPVWKTVNLAATVKGWDRFPAAQEMVDKLLGGGNRTLTAATVDPKGTEQIKALLARVAPDDAEKQKRLLEEFLAWREKQPQR